MFASLGIKDVRMHFQFLSIGRLTFYHSQEVDISKSRQGITAS